MADLVIAAGDHLHYADAFVLNELVIADAYHLHVPDTLGLYFVTDFSEYATGNALSDWTERWDTSNVSNIVQAGTWTYKLGKELYIDNNSTTRKLLTWDDIDAYDAENVDMLVLFKPTTLPANPIRFFVRASGATLSENGYGIQASPSNLTLFRYVNGTSFNVTAPASYHTASSYYWLRFRVNGTSLKVKAWAYHSLEPFDWDIDVTNSDVTGSGWCGIGAYTVGDSCVYYFAATLGGTASPEIPEAYTGISHFGSISPFPVTSVNPINYARTMGGTFKADKPQYLTGAGVYCYSVHTAQIRLAVYSGGDLSTGPDGAELLVDLGQTSGSDTFSWVDVSCSPVLIPQDKPLWLVFKGNDSGYNFLSSIHPPVGGNWQNALGRYAPVILGSDETVAYPDPYPSDTGVFSDLWYGMRINISEGVTELVIAGDYCEHYADNTTLNLLTIDDAYHVHAADNVDLLSDLVIPDGYLDIFTDPIALTQEHELAVALDNFHLHDADAPDLYFTLAIPGAFHLHDADTSDLTAPINLLLHDTVHSVYNDDPILQFDTEAVEFGAKVTTGLLITNSHSYYCGNVPFWPGCKIRLKRYYLYVASQHDGQGRLAVYQGGSSDMSDPDGASGADLIHDFGETSGSGTEVWVYIDAPAATYLNNSYEPVWLINKSDDPLNNFFTRAASGTTPGDFGLIGNPTGRTAKVSDDTGTPPLDADSTTAYPATFPDPDAHTTGSYVQCIYLTLEVTTHTNLIVKPGISEHFADNIAALTETEYMAVQDAFHLHEADPLTLTQEHDLAVNESHHLLIDDPFPLTMNLLVALENDHLHFADQANVVPIILILAADCYHENIPDPIDLVQLHILTVVECYHAHDGPNIALTQEHNLAVSESHSLHFADNVSIFSISFLIVQESYHLHVSDACDPIKAWNLLVAQGWFEHYSDTLGLIAHLDISETYHEHYSDALILSLHLVVADSNHEIHTDPLPLAQDHSLAVLGTFHEHFVDQADLTEIATLVINPCFHLHEAEPLAFCLHLIVQEAYHEHYADQATLLVLLILAGSYHLLDSDSLIIEQLHYLEIAGAGHNTSTNYHVLTSDNMDWGYLLPDLGYLSLVITTTDRTLEPRTPVLSLKWIQDQRDLENVTIYRTMRKAA